MIDSQKFSAWISNVQGEYINMDGAYGAQCWDLHAHFADTFGLPRVNTSGPGRWPDWAGNMYDAYPQTPEIEAAYERVPGWMPAQAGDTAIWGDTFWYYPKTHVAEVIQDGAQLLCMSQNSTPSVAGNPYPQWTTGPTTIQHLPKGGLLGYLRPRDGIAPQGGITTEEGFMANASEEQLERLVDAADRIIGVLSDPHAQVLTTNDLPGIAKAVLTEKVPLAGGRETDLQTKITFMKQEFNVIGARQAATDAKIDALAGVVAQGSAASKEEIIAQLDASVKASFDEYVPSLVKKESA